MLLRAEIEQAAEKAGIAEWVTSLEHGYDTLLEKEEEAFPAEKNNESPSQEPS